MAKKPKLLVVKLSSGNSYIIKQIAPDGSDKPSKYLVGIANEKNTLWSDSRMAAWEIPAKEINSVIENLKKLKYSFMKSKKKESAKA